MNDNDYNNINETENTEPINDVSENENSTPEAENNGSSFGEFNGQPRTYEPVNYTPVTPVKDNAPVSKGLKVFAAAMAGVILLTAACMTGYMYGKNTVKYSSTKKVSVSLASKPKDTDEFTAAQVYDQADNSIVGIYVYNTAGKLSQASGVVYSKDGYIVTNDHIYSEVPSPKFKVYTADGKEYDAKYVAGDKISDLAVLKIDATGLTAAEFGNSDEIVCGENVVAIGRPSGASHNSSITKGIISLTSNRVKTTSSYSARLIQTDSAINPGSSGGALLNMYAQVIGITSSKISGVAYDSVGYAIPTTTVKRIVEELISDGKITTRAKLGITYNAVDSVAAELGDYSQVGLYVAAVNEDSDLYGKLNTGDIITKINGIDITSDEIVLNIIEDSRAGDKITIEAVTSNGSTVDLEVKLSANVSESSYSTEDPAKQEDNSSEDNSSGGGTFNFPFGE